MTFTWFSKQMKGFVCVDLIAYLCLLPFTCLYESWRDYCHCPFCSLGIPTKDRLDLLIFNWSMTFYSESPVQFDNSSHIDIFFIQATVSLVLLFVYNKLWQANDLFCLFVKQHILRKETEAILQSVFCNTCIIA